MKTILRASGLDVSYSQVPVLKDVALEMSSGEIVALLGPNGSGKSTLIRALLGQVRAGGAIEWEDRPLRSWSRTQLARRIAYLPQSPTFEPSSRVADVLRLGRSAYWRAFGIESPGDIAVVREVADLLELTDLLDRRMDELSGGQRQRAFIGRCLAQQPAAMLLDEPSTFLDLRHQVELCQLLRRLSRRQGIAVLMASHDLNLSAAFADRMVLLDQGRITAAGAPAQVLSAEQLSRTYGVPLDRVDRPGDAPVIVPRVIAE